MDNKSNIPGLLLIGGLARSGTSLLQELCNNHPQMTITYEFRSFLNTGKRFPEYFRGLRKSGRRLNPNTPRKRRLLDLSFIWHFNLLILRRGLRRISIEHIHKTLQFIFPNAILVGDKYPFYLWHLSKLTAYDGIRIVIVYRDGRDVAQSINARMKTDWKDKKWAQKKYSNFSQTALTWVRAIELMEEYADQIYIIRYEEFVTNPKAELARLAEYLRVDPAGFKLEMIKSSSIGKYKQFLTKEQIAELVEVAGPTLERLGYIDSQ